LRKLTLKSKLMLFDFPLNFIDRVDIIIIKNLANEAFTPCALSKAMNLSYSQVYRKIKRSTGNTPSQYIRKIRLEKAYQLLKHSDLMITEIASKVGFKSLSYFSYCFSKYFEDSPYYTRKRMLKNLATIN